MELHQAHVIETLKKEKIPFLRRLLKYTPHPYKKYDYHSKGKREGAYRPHERK